MELQVIDASNNGLQSISSREVAEMMEIRHDNLLAKIEKHSEIFSKLTDLKNKVSGLWEESTYTDSTGRNLREFKVTKKGCEFLAHKTTGEKGDLFTMKYMERFEQMEQQLSNPYAGLSKELQAIFTLDNKQQEQEKRITKIEDKMTVNYELAENIRTSINIRAIELLGGKNSEAYKKLNKKLYSAFHRDIKRTFKVNSYKNLSVKNYDKAILFIEDWVPKDEVLIYAIQGLNSQLAFA